MALIIKPVSWDLPDGWKLMQPPKLIPVAGINNAWLVFYRRKDSFLTLLIGQYSGQVINWCYGP